MVTPGCLPLTTEYFPSKKELETCYDINTYDLYIDSSGMRSFFVKCPLDGKESVEQARQAWALAVMRSMAALRIVQGFQFVIRPDRQLRGSSTIDIRSRSEDLNYIVDYISTPKPSGVTEIFDSSIEPVFLSMSNEIHRISYTGEQVHVRRYVRRGTSQTQPIKYKCLVWPKLGVGYTEFAATLGANGLDGYNWNR